MRRKTGVMFLAGVLAISLAGCEAQPMSDGGRGTVVERWTEEARNSPLTIYYLTVDPAPGYGKKNSTGRVSKSTYAACRKGDAWPECKR